MSYDNDMQVIIKKVVSDKQNAPSMGVEVTTENGKKYKAPVWPWRRKDGSLVKDKNGNMQYKGPLKVDDFVPKGTHQGPERTPVVDEFDDEIPF